MSHASVFAPLGWTFNSWCHRRWQMARGIDNPDEDHRSIDECQDRLREMYLSIDEFLYQLREMSDEDQFRVIERISDDDVRALLDGIEDDD